MKSKRRKRVIASVLCMVLMLSTGMSTLAEADAGAVPAVEEATAAQTTAQETKSTSTDAQTAETETQTQTETETQTETKQTEEAAQTQPEETTAAQPTEEASGGETTQTETDQTAQNTQDQTTSVEISGTETQNEAVETQPEETETTTQTEETQETKEEAGVSPAFNETYENSEVTVKVTADEGIVPEGAELSVTPIVKKEITDQMSEEEKAEAKKINDQYDLTEKKLSEDSDKNKEIMEGFLAYDISFLVDGKEVEPSGDVKVVIDFKKAAVPEGVSEDATVAVKHLKEDPTAEDGVVVENMDEKATVKTTEKAEVEKVELLSDSFSVYTITWWNGYYGSGTIKLHYVDEKGTDISGLTGEGTFPSLGTEWSENINIKDNYATVIAGYTFQKITVGGVDGTQTSTLKRNYDEIQYNTNGSWQNGEWRYSGNYNNWKKLLELKQYSQQEEADIYIVYKKDTSSGGEGGNPSLNEPSHRKYIKYNEESKDYTLTLDVTGERGDTTGVDVLLVIDQSASMGPGEGNYDLTDEVYSAVDSITDKILDKPDTKNRIAITGFSFEQMEWQYPAADAIDIGWTGYSGKRQIKSAVDNMDTKGGTNWQLAMREAENKLEDASENPNKKFVIFLSDGKPTQAYGVKNPENPDGYGTEEKEEYRKRAVTEVVQSTYLKNAMIYSTYLTKGTADGMKSFADELKQKGIQATSVDGSENLQGTLEDIVDQIITPVYKNVVIEDELSTWAEFVYTENNQLEYTVTYKTEDGDTGVLPQGQYTVAIVGKKITLDLSKVGNGEDRGALADGTTYSISFKIKPSEEAKNKYIEDHWTYPDVGEEGTDAEGNHTSVGKPGFFSNEEANVSYTVNEGQEETADYAKPVIQVDETGMEIPDPNPINGSITKNMGAATEKGYPITLEVKTRLKETSEDADVDVILVFDNSSSMNNSRLSATKTAAEAFVDNFVGTDAESVNEKHRIGIVTYGSEAQIHNYGSGTYFSNNVSQIKEAINGMSASGGTNIEDAFIKAQQLARQTDNRTYVIFMTDGVPTYRNINYGYGSSTSDGDGAGCSKAEFNEAVEAANVLKNQVSGIYTVGLLINMQSGEKDVARMLLASPTLYQTEGYRNCFLYNGREDIEAIENLGSRSWNTTVDKTYSDGYFEIQTVDDAGESLKAIWEALADIINSKTDGSTGDGWTVRDEMADYTTFKSLDGSSMNGHELQLSADGKKLTTKLHSEESSEQNITVAQYDSDNKTITWFLNSQLANQEATREGTNYTYRLTYYVTFEDSQKTELRPTNKSTYIDPGQDKEKIYPEKMPFFVNVIGIKQDEKTNEALAGAEFKVYRDEKKTEEIGTLTSGTGGHFAFQIGQSDMELQSDNSSTPEQYSMTVYLEETKAPNGYIKDNTLHAITIEVSNVTYQSETSGSIQKGTPSGTVSISCDSNDQFLKVNDQNGTFKLIYLNKSKPSWGLVKRNGNNPSQFLAGAEFALYKKAEDSIEKDPSYTAISGVNGVINQWTKYNATPPESIESKDIPVGTYVLKETKAPDGYSKSEDEWTIVISESEVSITGSGGTVTEADYNKLGLDAQDKYFYFDNVMLYELPEAGGPGTFGYTIGGVLLLMAGTLILYKLKKGEVLKK